jgi:hypothetical protein
VADPGGVGRAQCCQHLAADPGGLDRVQRAAVAEPVREAVARDQLHHQPGEGAFLVDDVMDRHDIRVADAGQRAGLAKHAFAQHA